jgi:ElaB/YqjD/DUF883 family membrane-anchored ribosome-binding protein
MNKNLTETLDETLDSLTETAQGVVAQGTEKVEAVKTRLVDIKDRAVTRGDDLMGRAAELVQAHPLKSVAIAFGAGCLVRLAVRVLDR